MNNLCIHCGKEAEYPITTSVDKRFCYVLGHGQIFEDCYREVYGLSHSEAKIEDRERQTTLSCSVGAREDLGRPTTTALGNKENCIKCIFTL